MSYFGDVWSNLVFNTGNATTQFVNSLNWRYQDNGDKDVEYVSQSAYKSVLVHVAKQLAMSTLEGELNSLLPKYQKYARDKMRDAVRKEQDSNRTVLINRGKASTEGFGYVDIKLAGGEGVIVDESGTQKTSPSKHRLIAKTKYGDPVPEALILSYDLDDSEEPIEFTDVTWSADSVESYTLKKKSTLEKLWNPGNEIEHNERDHRAITYSTRTVFHIDLVPKVSMSSSKNIVLTQVQGRDFTRKELVSGGDLTYTVNGTIVSDDEGVYPSEAVKRFIRIMQYNGIVNVNFITFGLLGVKRIIIKDFSLGTPEFKNIQPYSFTCVAVEPDDAIALKSDTIASINESLKESMWDTWYKSILDNKLAQMAAQTALNVATSAATSAAGAGLDALTTNI